MPDVESTMIRTIDHDGKAGLYVTFTSGQTYVYEGVTPALYAEFLAAASKGSFFNEAIRDAYPFWKITAPPARAR